MIYKTFLFFESLVSPVLLGIARVVSSKLRGTVLERLTIRKWPDVTSAPADVWVHAASVGELIGVYPLINELIHNYGATNLVITCQSPNGLKELERRYPRVRQALLPADSFLSIYPIIKALKLKRLIVAESELWPGLISAAKEAGAEVEFVNAKISDYSWPKLKRLKPVLGELFSSLDMVLCQSELDASRFRELGARAVKVTGNIKYDFNPQEAAKPSWLGSSVFVAGSVREGEEELVIEGFRLARKELPELQMVFAPRQVEKFNYMYEKLSGAGFKVARRSLEETEGEVVLLDTMGDLATFYQFGFVAFVGGSLISQGGHNPLEPASYGVPVVMGPHYSKVSSVAEELIDAGGLDVILTSQDLKRSILRFKNFDARQALRRVAGLHRGATSKTLVELGLSTLHNKAA